MRLQLTRRGDYAIRAALALARLPPGRVMSARAISEAVFIPAQFVPQVMAALARGGIVMARSGRTGGYHLTRSATDISVLDVVDAVEGDSRRTRCVLRGGACRIDGVCPVHNLFFAAQEAMLDTLAGATLADVAGQGELA